MKILYNARIHTFDENRPLASAIAVEGGRIVAVGGEELLEAFLRAERQDMYGRAILPGLTDAHIHLKAYALSLDKIDCETETLVECLGQVSSSRGPLPACSVGTRTRMESEHVG